LCLQTNGADSLNGIEVVAYPVVFVMMPVNTSTATLPKIFVWLVHRIVTFASFIVDVSKANRKSFEKQNAFGNVRLNVAVDKRATFTVPTRALFNEVLLEENGIDCLS